MLLSDSLLVCGCVPLLILLRNHHDVSSYRANTPDTVVKLSWARARMRLVCCSHATCHACSPLGWLSPFMGNSKVKQLHMHLLSQNMHQRPWSLCPACMPLVCAQLRMPKAPAIPPYAYCHKPMLPPPRQRLCTGASFCLIWLVCPAEGVTLASIGNSPRSYQGASWLFPTQGLHVRPDNASQ